MKVKIDGGKITVAADKLSPKQANELIKEIKDAVRDLKKNYCNNGHLRTPDNWRWAPLKNGYQIKKCKVCRLKWEKEYFSSNLAKLEQVRASARARSRARRAGYACTVTD